MSQRAKLQPPAWVTTAEPRLVSIAPRFVPNGFALRTGVSDDVRISPGRLPLFADRARALAALELAREAERMALARRKAAEKSAEAALSEFRAEAARHALAGEVVGHWERLLELEPDQVPASGDATDAVPAPA